MSIDRLEKLQKRLKNETDVELLQDYLEEAETVIKSRRGLPYNAPFPDEYSSTAVTVAEYLYSRRGAIGEVVHIENGVNRHYGDGYVPESMLRNIVPLVKVYK